MLGEGPALSEYKVGNDATLHVSLRMRGGAPSDGAQIGCQKDYDVAAAPTVDAPNFEVASEHTLSVRVKFEGSGEVHEYKDWSFDKLKIPDQYRGDFLLLKEGDAVSHEVRGTGVVLEVVQHSERSIVNQRCRAQNKQMKAIGATLQDHGAHHRSIRRMVIIVSALMFVLLGGNTGLTFLVVASSQTLFSTRSNSGASSLLSGRGGTPMATVDNLVALPIMVAPVMPLDLLFATLGCWGV